MIGTPTTVAPKTALGKKLVKAGYRIVQEVETRKNGLDTFKPGRWYEVITPNGLTAAFLKQGEACFHVFGTANWTASGSSIQTAHLGGLGDAITTTKQLKTYSRLVSTAPTSLRRNYDGLYSAQQSC